MNSLNSMTKWVQCLLIPFVLFLLAMAHSSPARAQAGSSSTATPARLARQAAVRLAGEEYAEALRLIEQGLAHNPSHLGLLQLRAQILLRTKQCEAAREAYEDYLAAGPPRGNSTLR